MKKALITGVTGQDGSYLSEFLMEKGYDVHGIIRRSSVDFRERIAHLEGKPNFHLHFGDLSDTSSLVAVIGLVRPDEIYNLAAQSHVQVSFDSPEYTADIDATGVLRVLEAVRICGLKDTCRIYQASTSELYGKVEEVPQSETTPFHPYSPYAVAKQYGFWITKEYREAYNMFCCSGILFNHESERRGETFVTRKITLAAARIAQGKQDKLFLGNLSSLRDWGYARDYVECMWLILQHETPEDFVIATGVQHSVREFATLAFHHAGIELEWTGEGMDEKGIDKATGKVLVEVSPDFYRPTDVVNLWGDPSKAKRELGWNPTKTSFEELVQIMVEHDMKKVAKENAVDRILNLAEYLASSCIYPRMAPQPMPESCLLTSELEKTNEGYALAKISGLKYCEFLNKQYGTDFISVMPTNLYGPNDNYHPLHSHVLPALIRRFHEAKEANAPSVTCWGDGSPLREFLYVDDLANLCVFLMNNYSGDETVNAGTGKELTIKELTELVAKVMHSSTKCCACRECSAKIVVI